LPEVVGSAFRFDDIVSDRFRAIPINILVDASDFPTFLLLPDDISPRAVCNDKEFGGLSLGDP